MKRAELESTPQRPDVTSPIRGTREQRRGSRRTLPWLAFTHPWIVSLFRFYSIEKSTYFHGLKKKKEEVRRKVIPPQRSSTRCPPWQDITASVCKRDGERGGESESGAQAGGAVPSQGQKRAAVCLGAPCGASGHRASKRMAEPSRGLAFWAALLLFVPPLWAKGIFQTRVKRTD